MCCVLHEVLMTCPDSIANVFKASDTLNGEYVLSGFMFRLARLLAG